MRYPRGVHLAFLFGSGLAAVFASSGSMWVPISLPHANDWSTSDTPPAIAAFEPVAWLSSENISSATPVSESVDCRRDVWHHLETCGWAGPENTGYPGGIALTATNGRTITTDNAVIDGEKITGALKVAAKNVTIRNSWIVSDFRDLGTGTALNGTGVITIGPGASATVSRCTLDGSNATHAGIWHTGTRLTAIRNNIFGVNDGIFSWPDRTNETSGWNVTIEDNYLHDFTTLAANGHIDGYQTEGASHGIIRHNTFYIKQDQNAAVSIWNSRRDSDDFLIDNNLAAGAGFLMYAEDYDPSEHTPAAVTQSPTSSILTTDFRRPCIHAQVGTASGTLEARRATAGTAPVTKFLRPAKVLTSPIPM